MNKINALIPFNLLVDTDMGLLKLLEYEFDNHEYFLPGILHTSETNQLYTLLTRTHPNPLSVALREENEELMESLYSQFMEREYDSILSLSSNTMMSNLVVVLHKQKSQIIKITALCSSEKERDILVKREINVHNIIIGEPGTTDISKYDSIYVKNVNTDLDAYQGVHGKNIYVPNYGFNIIMDERFPEPLIKEDPFMKYSESNDMFVFSLYSFDPRKIPLG